MLALVLAACAVFRYTPHRQPTQEQAANTSGRISEEGIKSPTGNTPQATYTPYKLLLLLQSSLIIKQDKYTEANIMEEKNNEKNNKQATYTLYNILLILQSSLIIKQDKYTEANIMEEKKNEKEKERDEKRSRMRKRS